MNKIAYSVYDNEETLLCALVTIHNENQDIELDPMYFKGNFYKGMMLPPKYIYDINPLELYVKKADARNLCMHENNSINSMILDPPFMFGIHGKTKNYYSSRTHGIFKDFTELKDLYIGILKEARRILKKNGLLIFKCQDYTDSKTTMTHCYVYNWATELGFYTKDLAILVLKKGKVANPNLKQRHFRKIHSYFWIFRKRI